MDNRNLKRLAYGAGMLAGVVGAYLCYNQYMSKYKKIVNKSAILTDTSYYKTSFDFESPELEYAKEGMLTKASLLLILRDLKDHFIHHIHLLRRLFRDERRPHLRNIPEYEKIVNAYNELYSNLTNLT